MTPKLDITLYCVECDPARGGTKMDPTGDYDDYYIRMTCGVCSKKVDLCHSWGKR